MASMAAAGLINAMAFAGAGFLFKKMDSNGYEEENRRHNRATEELARSKEAWFESEAKKKDRIAEMRLQLSDANADINATNKALDALRAVTYNGKTFTREPDISDYYRPSYEMEGYQHLVVGAVGLGMGWDGYKLASLVL